MAAGAGLAFAGGSQAAGHRQVRCGRGYVRHSVRVPERHHGRIVRRHGRIVYVHVARCVKVPAKPQPKLRHTDFACGDDDSGGTGPSIVSAHHDDDRHGYGAGGHHQHGDDFGGYDDHGADHD